MATDSETDTCHSDEEVTDPVLILSLMRNRYHSPPMRRVLGILQKRIKKRCTDIRRSKTARKNNAARALLKLASGKSSTFLPEIIIEETEGIWVDEYFFQESRGFK